MTEKTYTITELKTFIEAVEFAADTDNWVPSERQWTRIRTMINNLVEPAKAAPVAPTRQYIAQQYDEPVMVMPQVTSPLDVIPMGEQAPARPAGPSAFNQPQIAQQMPQMRGPSGPFAHGGQQAVRTPDIDTTNGNYRSAFV